MYDTYLRMVGESVFYRHQIYRYKVKERRKDKAKIQELTEIIHEQNFLLQHNDQYMLELENQLEALAVPPLGPVIPGPAQEEEVEDIQGESGIESGPESS
jgi:hypothetical protein